MQNHLVPPSEFDDWAPGYDESTRSDSGFPFDGYSRVLQTIVDLCAPQAGESVLDLGAGTGNLAQMFAERGCRIWGVDFSEKMLALAREKLPGAALAQADVRGGWPEDFQRRYDCIVSGYTFHHFTLEEKVNIVQRLLQAHLAPGGSIVIGDLAFNDAADEDALRQKMGDEWEQEYFWLADEALAAFARAGVAARFVKLSSCAGVFSFGAAAGAGDGADGHPQHD
jgi:putative AdoMet-dependent methyltransferase